MIRIEVDPSQVNGFFIGLADRQVPFAMSLALNRVAVLGQKAERDRLSSKFKLRREAFNLQGIYISKTDRATKSSWVVTIQLQGNRDYLGKFEDGGYHVPRSGKKLFVPNSAVFQSKIIGRDNPLHPKNLHLHKDASGRIVGNEGSFLARTPKGTFVLQRQDRGLQKKGLASAMKGLTLDNVQTGMGPHQKGSKGIHRTAGTRLLYTLKSRVPVPAKLVFRDTIRTEVTAAWPEVASAAVDQAIKSAR